MPRVARTPDCHPERKHFAKGLCSQCYFKNRPDKEVRKIKAAAYYAANKNEISNRRKKAYQNDPELRANRIKSNSKWAKENPDKRKEIVVRYRETHRAELCDKSREYRQRDPEAYRAKQREKYANNREARTSYMRNWRDINKSRINEARKKSYDSDAQFFYTLKCNKKLSRNDYLGLLEFQSSKCATCRRTPAQGERLDVDHKHREGYSHKKCEREDVRGILCGHCNRAMGLLNEDTSLLGPRFQEYLNDPPFQRYLRSLTDQIPVP